MEKFLINGKLDLVNNELYREIVENTFEATILHSDYKVLYVNETAAKMLGSKKEDLIGAEVLDIFPENAKESIKERVRKALEEEENGELIEQTILSVKGEKKEVELYCQPFKLGENNAILSVLRDITSRKELERKLQKSVDEISTPIVPLLDGISVIPLVGTIDEEKSKSLLDSLPASLKLKQDTRHIIIDFSGIYNIDEIVVEFLSKINSIMRMLGVCSILTGIRPGLAKKALSVGVRLNDIKTMKDVKQALAFLKSNQ
jgi:rsbT co-antagonist protein RsbR